jgi:hypothetical protein
MRLMNFLCLFFFLIFPLKNLTAQVFYFSQDENSKSILSSVTSSEDPKSLLLKQIEYLNASDRDGLWRIEFNQVESLPKGHLAQIYPKSIPGEPFKVVIDITSEGLKNPLVVTEQMIHLNQIFGNVNYSPAVKRTFISPLHWGETVTNDSLGSLSAKKKLAAVKLEAYLNMNQAKSEIIYPKMTGVSEELLKSYIDQKIMEAQAEYDSALKAEKAFLKEAQKKWDIQREKFPSLESQEDKINDLIAKNDRKGVKKLLEDYLPWPLMEPTEEKMWRQWLDAIENPELGEKKLIFRGLDEDVIPLGKDGKPYQMSTVLTKNQGNYNRRLRSLTTMREKIGASHFESPLESSVPNFKENTTLSLMMRNHADDPKGSPFLSTSQHDVAARFGGKKRVALLINENRLIKNIHTTYIGEREILIPLIIFPDEVVHYVDLSKTSELVEGQRFLQNVETKLGRTLTSDEIHSSTVSKKDFVKMGLNEMNDKILTTLHLTGCLIESSASCNCSLSSLNELLK